ncbi:hypothetical protein BJ944DRAFT_261216 [Cunninghamella echinulata]|nr:hypothetical protein BJ944DRAFT_261216 [Cunninghamella echinulata]
MITMTLYFHNLLIYLERYSAVYSYFYYYYYYYYYSNLLLLHVHPLYTLLIYNTLLFTYTILFF